MADSLLEKYLCCHVCSEIYTDPVSLSCLHNFCFGCISKFWDETKNSNCPICKRTSSKGWMPNFALKDLADSYTKKEKGVYVIDSMTDEVIGSTGCGKEEERGSTSSEKEEMRASKDLRMEEKREPIESGVGKKRGSTGSRREEIRGSTDSRTEEKQVFPDLAGQVLCSKHAEKHKWFCMDEGKAVCNVCENPTQHSGHKVIDIEKAVVDLKEKLKLYMKPMQDNLKKCTETERKYKHIVQHTKTQLVDTERQIKEAFEKLHQFLRDEEKARLGELRKEEQQKRDTMTTEIKIIHDQISSLTTGITALEQDLKKQDLRFLKSYKNIQMSCRAQLQCTPQDPKILSGVLIDVAKHLGNLKFRVWEKMLVIANHTPVIMDPNTAPSFLTLSDDLTSVRNSGMQQMLPDNPERCTFNAKMLGSEGFTSGKHSWEVEVRNHPSWNLGVAKDSINRKDRTFANPKYGIWAIGLENSEYTDPEARLLALKRRPQRVMVQLDYSGGELSFYDPRDMSRIYTHKDTFNERLFPYFSIGKCKDASEPGFIQICPSKVSLKVVSS
ncbi:E3 ubiquitin-protein ligase TRIM35-like [Oncorhynchus keta]|uniref:E3 ubiquitin-protein ligase TRIM35-like n=1 Tax=Oncorhynchus keta TaxID=8018 RepID=UPI0015FAD3B4|nr:E3 ubiquitin-protein ligase TRIM35-like [Oncorhynchus keta]